MKKLSALFGFVATLVAGIALAGPQNWQYQTNYDANYTPSTADLIGVSHQASDGSYLDLAVPLSQLAVGSSGGRLVYYPDDYHCTGTTDQTCIQAAIDASAYAVGSGSSYGVVRCKPSHTYVLTGTITEDNKQGGLFDCAGALLKWNGATNIPMFLVTNVSKPVFRNLNILAVTHLLSAFDFGTADAGHVVSTEMTLDNVAVEGVSLGVGLDYGVRWLAVANGMIDGNNDQARVINSSFRNVTTAALWIGGTQSHNNQFSNLKATGASGGTDTSCIRTVSGSFAVFGGGCYSFTGAALDIQSINGEDWISKLDVENTPHYLRTSTGVANYVMPVHIIAGRYGTALSGSYTGLAADCKVIDFRRNGPLTVDGLLVIGPVAGASSACGSSGTGIPLLSFAPNSTYPGKLDVRNLTLQYTSSNANDFISLGATATATAAGNMCTDSGDHAATCIGITAGRPFAQTNGAAVDSRVLTLPRDGSYVPTTVGTVDVGDFRCATGTGDFASQTYADFSMACGFNVDSQSVRSRTDTHSSGYYVESNYYDSGLGYQTSEQYFSHMGNAGTTTVRPLFFQMPNTEAGGAAKGYVSVARMMMGGVRGTAGVQFTSNTTGATGGALNLITLHELTKNSWNMYYDTGSGTPAKALQINTQGITAFLNLSNDFNSGQASVLLYAKPGGGGYAGALTVGSAGGNETSLGNAQLLGVDMTSGASDGINGITVKGKASGAGYALGIQDSAGTAQWTWDRTGILSLSTTQATTGSSTATFTATNKPGSSTAVGPTMWHKVKVGATTYWGPLWAD